MHSFDGSIPAPQLQACLDQVRLDPPHPGSILRDFCLTPPLSTQQAASLLGIDPLSLQDVLEARASISPDLALRLEAAGWSQASLWLDLQSDYDLAQARRNHQAA